MILFDHFHTGRYLLPREGNRGSRIMPNPIVERELKELTDLLRPVLERTFEAGALSERERVVKALPEFLDRLQGSYEPAPVVTPADKPHTHGGKRRRGGKKGLREGSVNYMVYQTIQTMTRPETGVDAHMVSTECSIRGHPLDVVQIRTALKLLGRMRYLTRLERGKYTLKQETPSEDQSEGVSGSTGEGPTSPNESYEELWSRS